MINLVIYDNLKNGLEFLTPLGFDFYNFTKGWYKDNDLSLVFLQFAESDIIEE